MTDAGGPPTWSEAAGEDDAVLDTPHAESVSGPAGGEPILGPTGPGPGTGQLVAVPRLARHEIVLDDEHRVGVSVCGQGVPVVLVHGFTAEGILYAQTLSRLVQMGFKVIAIDVAGHGSTHGLPTDGHSLGAYATLLGRVLDELGIRRAVLAGHSMGGRLVAELAARNPERAIAVVLIDAAVGQCWDRLITVARFAPPVLAGVAALLVVDSLSTLPWLRDRRQAAKLARLALPTMLGHVRRPWRLLGPAISLIRSPGTTEMLEELGDEGVPVVVIHGDRDLAVPYATAVDAARRSGGTLVTINGGTHAWVLKDPEVLPAVVAELLDGPLARVRAAVLGAAGHNGDVTPEQLESAFLGPHAWVRRLTPPLEQRLGPQQHRHARFRWTVSRPGDRGPADAAPGAASGPVSDTAPGARAVAG
jgi:pimeloyl-ACP methyl ester carboxylesterase